MICLRAQEDWEWWQIRKKEKNIFYTYEYYKLQKTIKLWVTWIVEEGARLWEIKKFVVSNQRNVWFISPQMGLTVWQLGNLPATVICVFLHFVLCTLWKNSCPYSSKVMNSSNADLILNALKSYQKWYGL